MKERWSCSTASRRKREISKEENKEQRTIECTLIWMQCKRTLNVFNFNWIDADEPVRFHLLATGRITGGTGSKLGVTCCCVRFVTSCNIDQPFNLPMYVTQKLASTLVTLLSPLTVMHSFGAGINIHIHMHVNILFQSCIGSSQVRILIYYPSNTRKFLIQCPSWPLVWNHGDTLGSAR